MADPDGKEMFLQLLSALKEDVAEKASTSSRTSQGQDGVSPGMAEMSNPLSHGHCPSFNIFVRTSCNMFKDPL